MPFIKTIFITLGFFFSAISYAQSLNNYQYVVVPEQFEFQKSPHQYDVNKLTQFLFNKYNFKALIKGEQFPEGVTICDALQASATSRGLTRTRLTLSLSDCNGKVIFTSPEGESKIKDFKKAYNEAMRKVFTNPALKSHKYLPVKKQQIAAVKPSKPSIPAVMAKPRPIELIKGPPKLLVGKKITKTPAKATGPDLIFELRGKQYVFQPQGKNYVINHENKPIGQATLHAENGSYILKAGALSGSGSFDDYGNFELNRVNPVTQKPIIDILARIN